MLCNCVVCSLKLNDVSAFNDRNKDPRCIAKTQKINESENQNFTPTFKYVYQTVRSPCAVNPVCLFVTSRVSVVLLNSRLFSLISLSTCPPGPIGNGIISGPERTSDTPYFIHPENSCLRYSGYFLRHPLYITPSF